jgi:hypothetical protein
MGRKLYGTRFTTGCGHSWRRRYPKWTIRDLSHASTDCKVCGELLYISGEQFEGKDSSAFPFAVHCMLFHVYMHGQDSGWPVDGAGTDYVEFDTE